MPFVPDTNSIPVSGRCQWPFNTHTISSKTQIQTIRVMRVAAANNRFILFNNTAATISFKMSFKVGFSANWAMVTENGSQTITIPAYGSTQTDVFAASLPAGAIVYTRTYHDVSSPTNLSSGYYGTGYEPENVGFSSGSGYNFAECLVDGLSTNRLLENGTTFEQDGNATLTAVQKYYGVGIFSPYGIIGVPDDPTLRLTTFLGDSKTQATGPDAAGQQGVAWPNIGMGFGTGMPYQNLGISGDSLNGIVPTNNDPSSTLRRELLVFGGDYVSAYGANSITNDSDPAAASASELGNIQSMLSILPVGYRFYQCTVDPRTNLAGGADWATVTDGQQTPGGNGNNGVATANYFNNLLKTTKPSYIAAVIDIAAPVTSGAGYWLPGMTVDGIHQSAAGNDAKAQVFASVWPFALDDESSSSSGSSGSSLSSASSLSSGSSSSSSSHGHSESSSSSSTASSHSSGSSSSSSSAPLAFPNTISPDRYLAIAQFYAEAYEGQIALISNFDAAVERLRCQDDVNVTLALLGPLQDAASLAAANLQDVGGYLPAVRSIQQHVAKTSGLTVAEWITEAVAGGKVPYAWALLSKQVGFDIDAVIDWTTESSTSST